MYVKAKSRSCSIFKRIIKRLKRVPGIVLTIVLTMQKDDDVECSICFTDYSRHPSTKMICGHLFHKQCIDTWTLCKNSCPLCRNRLYSEECLEHTLLLVDTEQWMTIRGGFDFDMLDYMRSNHWDAYKSWVVVNRQIEHNYLNNVVNDIELDNAERDLQHLLIEFWRDYSNYDSHRDEIIERRFSYEGDGGEGEEDSQYF